MKKLQAALVTSTLALGATLAAAPPATLAQGSNMADYDDAACGAWVSGAWVPNGQCPPDDTHLRHARLAGTIVFVKGHLVTLQQTDRQVVIDDRPALERQRTGRVAVGREVVAVGYWLGDTFYATHIE